MCWVRNHEYYLKYGKQLEPDYRLVRKMALKVWCQEQGGAEAIAEQLV